MKTLLLFQCEDKKCTDEVIFEIEGLPNMLVGDTFDLPMFCIEDCEPLGLGPATVARRHWRSKRKDLIIYCTINEMLMRHLRMRKDAGAGFQAELPKQTWSQAA